MQRNVVLFALLLSGCASPIDEAPVPERRGNAPPPLAAAPDRARALVVAEARRRALPLAPDDLALRDLAPDGAGGARVRFALSRGGLPIDGGDIVVVLGREGALRGMSDLPPSLDGIRPPRIDGASASRLALAAAGGELRLEQSPELIALPFDSGLCVAWRVLVSGVRGGVALRRELFVDAGDGGIVHQREGLRAVAARGSGIGVFGERRELAVERLADGYQLHDTTRGDRGIRTLTAAGSWRLPGAPVRSADAHAWDEEGPGAGAAVDAHANAAVVHDFLAEALGRDSWDGEGGRLTVVAHFGDRLDNAFWDGRRAVFGDGDGETSLPFGAALDIVAHEIFHGVIESEVALVYEGQPGAISESLADVFGSLVEQHAGAGDWIVGGEVIQPPLRDLARPARSDSPSHMSEYVELAPVPDEDMGGVHLNSTIPSHAAVLLADGGVHVVSGVRVPGVGREAMRRIWWRALTIYLAPRSGFRDLARATRASAEDLFGAGSREAEAARFAWAAVGIRP
jgi:Zn-dependent metalloprotease